MEAMKQSSIWTSNTEGGMWRRWHVGLRCQEGALSWLHFQLSHGNPTHVATMWQQTPSHYPRGSLPSICSRLRNWQLDCIELVQRLSGFLEMPRGLEIKHFCAFERLWEWNKDAQIDEETEFWRSNCSLSVSVTLSSISECTAKSLWFEQASHLLSRTAEFTNHWMDWS